MATRLHPWILWSAVLAAYGLAFVALRSWSTQWAAFELFSLWFPAAGLRFAFLWFAGPRIAPAAALAELLASLATGTVDLGGNVLLAVVGTLAPCLVYGVVIHLLRPRVRARADGRFDPLPFGAAAVIGPLLAGFGALAGSLPGLDLTQTAPFHQLFANLLVFTLGDLLGILLLAPPLLALADRLIDGRPLRLPPVAPARWVEMLITLGIAWAMVGAMYELGYGVVLAPVLLATCFAGLRSGRLVAWVAILISTLVILPLSVAATSEIDRIQAHMLLTCIAAGGYLVGSYAEAQANAIRDIRRRDRLLLQADRLRTLRAMSLGVIHEVSQPLSIIALEASSLTDAVKRRGDAGDGDVADMAARIARKASDLSDLVRRLRHFGEVGPEERSLVRPEYLLGDIVRLARPEADARGLRIEVSVESERTIAVSDVEMRQALLNLIRNALTATPASAHSIWVHCSDEGSDGVVFVIENEFVPGDPRPSGMRIGLVIARAIAAIHGGSILYENSAADRIRCIFRLPAAGPARGVT